VDAAWVDGKKDRLFARDDGGEEITNEAGVGTDAMGEAEVKNEPDTGIDDTNEAELPGTVMDGLGTVGVFEDSVGNTLRLVVVDPVGPTLLSDSVLVTIAIEAGDGDDEGAIDMACTLDADARELNVSKLCNCKKVLFYTKNTMQTRLTYSAASIRPIITQS
jgi:hypothetical protein